MKTKKTNEEEVRSRGGPYEEGNAKRGKLCSFDPMSVFFVNFCCEILCVD